MAEEKEVLLKVEHLEQYFRMGKFVNKAVDDIGFEIRKGEVFGLVGESGCGKTTTGRSIIRLYDVTGGSVYFKGQRICAGVAPYKREVKRARRECAASLRLLKEATEKGELTKEQADEQANAAREKCMEIVAKETEKIKAARYDHRNCNRLYAQKEAEAVDARYRPLLEAAQGEELERLTKEYRHERKLALKDRIMNKMQMIFQDPIASLDPRMTVREIIAEGLIIRGIRDKKLIDEKVYEVLRLVGLVPEHASRYPHEFSGGQRQRIGIARAVILDPEMIIADEPVSALDVSVQAQVINLLNDLRRELGLTILFIAHNLSVVKYFSDRIAVMYFGKIVEIAPSDELFAHPLHPYTKSLLSAIPIPDPTLEKVRQRIVYNPLVSHNYSTDKPSMRELKPGHFVYCNQGEAEGYMAELSR